MSDPVEFGVRIRGADLEKARAVRSAKAARVDDSTEALARPVYPAPPPLVTWRRDGCCSALLLRVYRTPGGWHLETKDFEVPAADWMQRYGAVVEAKAEVPIEGGVNAHRSGSVFYANLRKVRGLTRALPAALAEWDVEARFEVGCSHSTEWVDLVAVAQDCAEAAATRRNVARTVPAS